LKALLIGPNLGTLTIFKRLRSLGYSVHAAGHADHLTVARLSDKFHRIDYHSPESTNNLLDLIKPQIVVPGCHDMYYKAYCASKACKSREYTLSHSLISFYQIHSKTLFRNKLSTLLSDACPCFRVINTDDILDDIESKLGLPLICKPCHAGGGRGIKFINSYQELTEHHKSPNTTFPYILERIVPGIDISISIFLEGNGAGRLLYADTEIVDNTRFRVIGSVSSNEFIRVIRNSEITIKLINLAYRMGITNGLWHCQLRISDKSWKIIEITQRMPGDLYQRVPELFTAIDYTGFYLKSFGLQDTSMRISPLNQIWANDNEPDELVFGRYIDSYEMPFKKKVTVVEKYSTSNYQALDDYYNVNIFAAKASRNHPIPILNKALDFVKSL